MLRHVAVALAVLLLYAAAFLGLVLPKYDSDGHGESVASIKPRADGPGTAVVPLTVLLGHEYGFRYTRTWALPVTIGQGTARETVQLHLDSGSEFTWILSYELSDDLIRQSDLPCEEPAEIGFADGRWYKARAAENIMEIGDIALGQLDFHLVTDASIDTPDSLSFAKHALGTAGSIALAPGEWGEDFWIAQAWRSGALAHPRLTFDLDPDAGGTLYVGSESSHDFFWAKAVDGDFDADTSEGLCGLDSGASDIIIDDEAAEAYYSQISDRDDAWQRIGSNRVFIVKCDIALPAWTVDIEGTPFTVPGSGIMGDVITDVEDGSSWCKPYVQSAASFLANELGESRCIFGWPFLVHFITAIEGETDEEGEFQWKFGLAHRT